MARPGIGDSVEGIHAVDAALDAGRVERLIVERTRVGSLRQLIGRAEAAGAPIQLVDDARDHAFTTAPQGIVAKCRPIRTISLESAVAVTDPAALLVLDHLEDPRNVGAIARSAMAAGIGALVMSDRRSAPLGATAFKAAAGALETVRVAEVSSIPRALEDLRRMGVWSMGLDAGGERPLWGLDLLAEPVAVVVGAEGAGLSRLTGERCDLVAHIPIAEEVESLNASVAASLAAFEIMRVRSHGS